MRRWQSAIGDIKVKLHRPLPEGAAGKQAIIKRSGRKWFVCLSMECEDAVLLWRRN